MTAGPLANRKSETGGLQVGLGVSYRRRRETELTRPLRVESGAYGQTDSPGVDPSRRRPDHCEPRRGEPRPPELDEESAEGVGEPSTIERPRMRARFVDQGELARPPTRGGEAPRPNAAALARGVGHGIAVGRVNGIRQRGRDGGGATAEEAEKGEAGSAPVAEPAESERERGPSGVGMRGPGRGPGGAGAARSSENVRVWCTSLVSTSSE